MEINIDNVMIINISRTTRKTIILLLFCRSWQPLITKPELKNVKTSKYIANCACVDTLCYGNAIQSELNFPSLELLTAEWHTHDNPDHTALMHCLNTCRCQSQQKVTFLSCQIRDIEMFLHMAALIYPSIIDSIKYLDHYLLK